MGNLILRRFVGEGIAAYEATEDRKLDYKKNIKFIMEITEIKKDERRNRYYAKILLNGNPNIKFFRYELLPSEELDKTYQMKNPEPKKDLGAKIEPKFIGRIRGEGVYRFD